MYTDVKKSKPFKARHLLTLANTKDVKQIQNIQEILKTNWARLLTSPDLRPHVRNSIVEPPSWIIWRKWILTSSGVNTKPLWAREWSSHTPPPYPATFCFIPRFLLPSNPSWSFTIARDGRTNLALKRELFTEHLTQQIANEFLIIVVLDTRPVYQPPGH